MFFMAEERRHSSSRNFHFTWFGRPEASGNFCDIVKEIPQVAKAVAQFEVCPKTLKPHLQGLVVFKNELKWKSACARIQAVFPTAHVESAYKGVTAGFAYCTKVESRTGGPFYFPSEWKPRDGQGARTDIAAAVETLRDAGWDPLIDDHPELVVKYGRNFGLLRESFERRARGVWRDLRVLVIWGPPRTGKTRLAYSICDALYRLPVHGKRDSLWWCGYQGESVVLLDDFYGNLPLSYMLNLLDGHPLRLATKGGQCYAAYNFVVITSNVHPDEWYTGPNIPQQVMAAFKARLTTVLEVRPNDWSLLKDKTIENFFE